jgi:N-methylhydantoinase B
VWGYDGFEGAASITTLGEVARANVEEMEVRVPWWMLHYEFAEDSPGAGRWRGACGVRWAMRNDGGEAKMSTGNADAEVVVPRGVAGGGDCPPNRCWIVRGDQRTLAKVHRYFDLLPGDVILKQSGGGAGVGNPAERDPEAVREDVLDGILSHQTAREVYRVDIDPATNRIVGLLPPRRG